MTTISIEPRNVDQLLDARVAQTRAALEQQFLTMDARDVGEWHKAIDMKEDLVTATFAQQQNFVIQHHLAKTILSTT
jgi:hypothetical protein